MGLKFNCNSTDFLVLNIYMPYCCDSNIDEYLFYLNKINSVIDESLTSNVYVMGDFNSDVTVNTQGRIYHKFGHELAQFCKEERFVLSDAIRLDKNNSFTYYSEAHQTVSWIDHVLCTSNSDELIINIDILYDFISSDHHPIMVEIKCTNNVNNVMEKDNGTNRCKPIRWGDLSSDDLEMYTQKTEYNLSSVKLDHNLLLCDNPKCTDPGHTSAITRMFDEIADALGKASEELCKPSKGNFKHIPGWNDYCKAAHTEARK